MVLRFLLFPFSMVYQLITRLRNQLYDKGLKPSAEFDLPVINVGNLTVGGTGKSPMVEYLVKLLVASKKIATLSRGYGRQTKGFRIGDVNDNASTLGDEPFQFYRKFHNEITVAVGEERVLAISMILHEKPETEVIILDDAFQHRRVKPSLNILLCDYHRPFYKDYVLPAGRLRESRSGANRADIIVVTKCPAEITEEAKSKIRTAIQSIAAKPVFFTSVFYEKPISFHGHLLTGSDCIVVTGIANPEPFIQYLKLNYRIRQHLAFGDHHTYTHKDIERIGKMAEEYPGAAIFTTEKDMVKLKDPVFFSMTKNLPVYYIPIAVQFLIDGSSFDEMILNHVRHGE